MLDYKLDVTKTLDIPEWSSHFEFTLYEQLYNKMIDEYEYYHKIVFVQLKDLSKLINDYFLCDLIF